MRLGFLKSTVVSADGREQVTGFHMAGELVGMDGIKPILAAIHEGVIDASSATMPRMQGAMSILMLWQASLGVALPRSIDTGIDVITRENVDRYLREIS